MANIGKGRALRVCDACGGVDDHPRHILAAADPGTAPPPRQECVEAVLAADLDPADRARILGELYDTSVIHLHLDCCRAAGCPTGTCDELTAGAEDKRGAALLRHLDTLRKD